MTNWQYPCQGSRHPLVIAYDNVPSTQELDVAILKSTTNQFHVVPKEKHVRSTFWGCCGTHKAHMDGHVLHVTTHHPPTALKNAVHPAKPRREVQYLIIELLKRLYTANDWVVRDDGWNIMGMLGGSMCILVCADLHYICEAHMLRHHNVATMNHHHHNTTSQHRLHSRRWW